MNATDADPVELSIVVPAYNEERRLQRTLAAIDAFLAARGHPAEIIVADDGSDDQTAMTAAAFMTSSGVSLRILSLPHRGKASAVRDGVLAARGRFILFTDADLSTPMSFAPALLAALDDQTRVAVGSREGTGARRVGEPGYRHAMGRVFNWLVRALAVPGISDTQCGFKAFDHAAARAIFQRTRLHATETIRGPRVSGFDVEVLFIARRLGYRIVEIPVHWQHAPGSKVQPLLDPFRMFGDVVRVRLNAIGGRYDLTTGNVPDREAEMQQS